jgi:hypothetical protein
MSKRVLLGKFGTGSGEYGLRISKTGSDVINNDNTAVATDNLIFDSLNPVGSLGLYKVFLIEDVPVNSGQNTSPATATQGFGQGGTPGNTVQSFGETLGFIPLAICQQVGGSYNTTAGASYSTSVLHGWRSPANGGYQDSEGFDDGGWYFVTTTSQITIFNYGTSTIDVRAALFYTPS